MKKLLIVLAVVMAFTLPAQQAEASFVRELGRGCVVGGSIFAGTTYIGMTPALIGNFTAFPGYSLILNNAVIGCGLGAAGFAAGSIWAGLYGLIF